MGFRKESCITQVQICNNEFDQKKSRKMKRGKERQPQKSVRIVVLGDAGVGKSSLVTVFISAHFEENLSSLIPVAVSLSRTSSGPHVRAKSVD